MATTHALSVRKIKRSWCVVAGAAVLGKFRTESAADKSLVDDAGFYSIWAGSASVSIQNTAPVVVQC